MKEQENEKKIVRITDAGTKDAPDVLKENEENRTEKLKKPLIFALMGVVFLGCMYLIFKPSDDKKEAENIGLNDAVPQASEAGLQADKQKAYEQEMLEQKMQEKRNALLSLSDYWNADAGDEEEPELFEEDYEDGYGYEEAPNSRNPALNSYRSARSALDSFYEEPDYEMQELRRQVEELKEQLAEKEVPPVTTVDDQLALMEKSYEMAAKYLPQNANTGEAVPTDAKVSGASTNHKEHFIAFTPARKNTVSALYREPTDSAFLAIWSEERNRGFYTAGTTEQVIQPKNSIRAVIQETQVVTGESGVRVRLLETAQTPVRSIPAGTVLTANAKFHSGRLQLHIGSIELNENIIPVDISIYDLDGQLGLHVPHSPEMNAVSEIAANMSQTSGTSLMMTQSAGQQIAADLSRGVVQGISGYFSKKVRTPKVTVKAGHQIFLVSKN